MSPMRQLSVKLREFDQPAGITPTLVKVKQVFGGGIPQVGGG